MVEIGYAVDPAYRRRGYARAALEALLQRAAREPRVRTVRVTISPGNVAVLFQRHVGSERRAIGASAIRAILTRALAHTSLTDPAGGPLHSS